MSQGSDIAKAISVIMPIAKAFIEMAEEGGGSGKDKHAAVSSELEAMYRNMQETKSIKEINDIPWELIAPIIIPIGAGLISGIVSLFNSLGRFVRSLFSRDNDE